MTAGSGRRVRVVFVNRFYAPDHSATSVMLGGIARSLADGDFDVTVVTSRQLYEEPVTRLARRETLDGVDVIRVPGTRFGRRRLAGRAADYLSFYLSTFFALLVLLRPGTIVVAKTDPPLIALVCAPAAWLRRARLVNWLQDVFPEVATALGAAPIPGVLARALVALRDAVCRRAATNVVLGDRMRDFLLRRGVPEGRLVVIPNWADGALIVPCPTDGSRLRNGQGLAGKFVVAYCGNLGRAHDYTTLLTAARLLQPVDEVRFLIVGGGAGMEALRLAAQELALSSIRFVSYQPAAELADTLAAADVHLVCLRPELEGLIVPSKLYGILAAGRPAVFWGDRDGEIARELRRTGAGLSVASGDGAALAAAIESLRSDPVRRAAISRAARTAYVERYTREMAVARWQELLAAAGADSPIRHAPYGNLQRR